MTPHAARAHWEAFGASVQGATHRRRHLANQDAFATWDDAATGAALAAVADGHGSPLHPRSAIGAQLAVTLAIRALRALVPLRRPPDARARAAVLRRLTSDWREAVHEHLAGQPFQQDDLAHLTDDERHELDADGAIAYGATIVTAAATPDWLALLQIGDGDALAVAAAHHTYRPLPDDPRQRNGRTFSLCQPDAWIEGRTIVLDGTDLPELVLLSTDGYVDSFATDGDFLAIGADYAALVGEHPETLRARLPAILDETSGEGSGDDITLAVLHRAPCAPERLQSTSHLPLASRVRQIFDRLR